MNLTVALIQRASTTLEPDPFAGWLKEIYSLRFDVHANVTGPRTGKAHYMISVGYSVAGLGWLVEHEILTAPAVAGIFILAGLAIAVAVSVTWTKPVKSLAAGSSRVQEGDFDYRIPLRRRDELGRLAHDFNSMAEGLRDRELVKNTFKRYVTKQVAEKTLSQ